MLDGESFKAAMGCIALGGLVYYKSFIHYKLRRRMSDIPSSKIGSAALGSNVEVTGRPVKVNDKEMISPLTGKRGSAFIWQLEDCWRDTSIEGWAHLYTYHTSPYLYIHDGEGCTAAIDLSACEFPSKFYEKSVRFNNRSFKIPEEVKNLLFKSGMLDTTIKANIFNNVSYRLKEKVFDFNQSIYVLGAAVPTPKLEAPGNLNSHFLFGSRDEEANESLKKAKFLLTTDPQAEGVFKLKKVYLSTKSESHLRTHLRIIAFLGLIGGPLLIVLGVFMLIGGPN